VHIIEPSALQAECTTLHVSCAVHPVAPSPQHSTSAAQSCAQMPSSSAASITAYVSSAHLAHTQALSRLMHAPSAYVASAACALTSANWPQSSDALATSVDAGNSRNVVGAQQVLVPLSARAVNCTLAAVESSTSHLDVAVPDLHPACTNVSTAAVDHGAQYLDTSMTTSVASLTAACREVALAACYTSLEAQGGTLPTFVPLAPLEHGSTAAHTFAPAPVAVIVRTGAPASTATCPAFVPAPPPPAAPPDHFSMHVFGIIDGCCNAFGVRYYTTAT